MKLQSIIYHYLHFYSKFKLTNQDRAHKILSNASKVRHFMRTNEFGIKEVVQKEFKFTKRTKVAELSDGKSFGELALLNNKPRAATIIAIEDTDFATMDKPSFK